MMTHLAAPIPFWEAFVAIASSPAHIGSAALLFILGIPIAMAGIGGGGIVVAVLVFVSSLTPHEAVPVSKAIIFSGAVMTLLMNVLRRTRVDGGGSASGDIDWDLVRIVAPAALLGTCLGVILNVAVPDTVIMGVLVVVLVVVATSVLYKWHSQRAEEALHEAPFQPGRSLQQVLTVVPSTGALPGSNHGEATSALHMSTVAKNPSRAAQVPIIERLVLFSALLLVVCGGSLRHHLMACAASVDHADVEDLHQCQHPMLGLFGANLRQWMSTHGELRSLPAALCLAAPLVFCFGLAMWYCRSVARRRGVATVAAFASVALVTGVLSALVGIGGGLIFSPFLIIMNVDPGVAVATSAACVVFTSTSTTFQYVLIGRVNLPLALFLAPINMVASFCGTAIVHKIRDSPHVRRSHVTLLVAVLVVVSACVAVASMCATSKAIALRAP